MQFQWNQFGNGLITVPGVQGNADAFIAGPANNLQVIARTGDPAPGFPNLYLSVTTSNGSLIQNNAGEVMFTSALTPYAAGASIGVVGQTPAASVLTTPFNTVLWGWSSGFGLVPLLYGGQMIEVDPGVFKKISTISTNNADNGDGGSSELNDSGIFAVQVTFTDTSYSIIKLQIPAPGTGAMALLGLGALARRRRK